MVVARSVAREKQSLEQLHSARVANLPQTGTLREVGFRRYFENALCGVPMVGSLGWISFRERLCGRQLLVWHMETRRASEPARGTVIYLYASTVWRVHREHGRSHPPVLL